MTDQQTYSVTTPGGGPITASAPGGTAVVASSIRFRPGAQGLLGYGRLAATRRPGCRSCNPQFGWPDQAMRRRIGSTARAVHSLAAPWLDLVEWPPRRLPRHLAAWQCGKRSLDRRSVLAGCETVRSTSQLGRGWVRLHAPFGTCFGTPLSTSVLIAARRGLRRHLHGLRRPEPYGCVRLRRDVLHHRRPRPGGAAA
jgi:hypothetical protein